MSEPIHEEEFSWKGVPHHLALFACQELPDLHPVTQVQAVAFTADGMVVLYEHRDGYWGLPGGSVEDGEDYETALRREVTEEINCTILQHGLTGYEKDTDLETGWEKYQLRFWAEVAEIGETVQDPDGKALRKQLFSIPEAITVLNWGIRGQKLIERAAHTYQTST